MIKGKRVLWAINVYDRIDQLKQQEEAIRQKYGRDIDILVFCNNTQIPHATYREDILITYGKNSGHHGGVKDAHNANLPHLKNYDIIISSHADCFFTDWNAPRVFVEKMLADGKCVLQLECRERHNTHKGIVQPYTHNDFFIMDARRWERMGEITEPCDYDEGIEIVLAKNIRRVCTEDEIIVIPCNFQTATSPHMFENVYNETHMVRENDTAVKLEYLKNNCPDLYEQLRKANFT